MKLLFLCTDAYGGYGGIALYDRDFAEALASRREVREIVMVPRVIRGPLEPMPPKIHFVSEAARGRFAFMKTVLGLRRRRREFDLVVCGHVNLLPFARMFGRPTLLLIYGVEAWRPLRRSTARLLHAVSAVASISEITLRRFRGWSHYGGPAFLVPNAIHLDRYGMGPRDENLVRRFGLEGKRVLLTLGRIVPAERYKGFDEVLETLPAVIAECPDVVYVIAGDGQDIARLRAKAADLGVADHVVFTGMVEESEKAALYRLADVYVMPSRGEGFGFVLLEALACGVPVIASRIDGGFEAIRGGMLGRAVHPSSQAEIRVAILDLLASRTKEIPHGLSYFAFDNFVSRVHSVVDRMMEKDS